MDRKTKTWLIVLGVVSYGLWMAGLIVGEGPLNSLLGVLVPLLVGVMALVFWVGISAETQKQWDRLRAEGTQVTAVVKSFYKARVLFEIQLPGGSIGKELYPSYVDGITRQFLADACATGRPLEVLYLADSTNILIKDPATGKFT
jgi:hypothetical protein